MKLHRVIAAGALIALACTSAALAQTPDTSAVMTPDTTVVTVPWGDLISDARNMAIGIAVLGMTWLVRHLPATVVQMLRTMQAEQLLTRAIEYAINATADAVRGETLKIDTGNKVVAKALQYIIDHAPAWLMTWLGGESKVKEMIIARLDIEPAAEVKTSAAMGPTLSAPLKR